MIVQKEVEKEKINIGILTLEDIIEKVLNDDVFDEDDDVDGDRHQ